MVTAGIVSLGAALEASIVRAVCSFDGFTEDNDPYGEHDFASLDVEGHQIFFKIDYFDLNRAQHSPNPADPCVTERVLTIMLAGEW